MKMLWREYPTVLNDRIKDVVFDTASHSHWSWASLTEKMVSHLKITNALDTDMINTLIRIAATHDTNRWVDQVERWMEVHRKEITEETFNVIFIEASKHVRNSNWELLLEYLHQSEGNKFKLHPHTIKHMEKIAPFHASKTNRFSQLVHTIKNKAH